MCTFSNYLEVIESLNENPLKEKLNSLNEKYNNLWDKVFVEPNNYSNEILDKMVNEINSIRKEIIDLEKEI